MIHNVDPQLNQWDCGRIVKVSDSNATHVHFANQGDSKAVIIEITNGEAKIPDYLLQTGKAVFAYAVLNGVTLESRSFSVRKRERPESYVYEDDQRNYIYALIADAEKATQDANQAAENANQAATGANTVSATANLAAQNAINSANSASLAAQNANKAADNANNVAKSLMVIGSARGNSINLDDAIDQFLVGMRIFGKTTQDGVPTPEAPVEMLSIGGGGSLGVSITRKNLFGGDALADKLVEIGNATKDTTEGTVMFAGNQVSRKPLYSGFKNNTVYTIILKGWNNFGDGSNLWINYTDGSNAYLTFPASKTLSTIVYKTAVNKTVKTIGGIEYAGQTYLYYNECGVFEGDIAIGDFETYIGRSVSVDTPYSLPGIPVSSGGNYTDANGQRWVCDEIDFARGVYVKRIQKDVFDGTETWAYYNSGNNPCFTTTTQPATRNAAMSSHFKHSNYPYTLSSKETGFFGWDSSNKYLYFASAESSAANWQAWLATNQVTVIYALETPIETPLSEEELAAYAALRTYRGNTTVSNDAGAWMEIEYVMDARKYIDSQIAAGILAATVE